MKNKFRKLLLTGLLAVSLALTFTACGDDESEITGTEATEEGAEENTKESTSKENSTENSSSENTDDEKTTEEKKDETGSETEAKDSGEDTGKTEDSNSSGIEDGQNPVMNYIGAYGNGRCTIDVQALGSDQAKVNVQWATSAAEYSIWDITGTFDFDTKTITYENAVKTNVEILPESQTEKETTQYSDGNGTIVFSDDPLSLTWNDETENIADGTVFTYASYGQE